MANLGVSSSIGPEELAKRIGGQVPIIWAPVPLLVFLLDGEERRGEDRRGGEGRGEERRGDERRE